LSGYQISKSGFPKEYGLYDPQNEHENCGFGFIANIQNQPKHEIVHQALEIVHNLDHRGAVGSDPLQEMEQEFLYKFQTNFLEMNSQILILLYLN